MDSERLHSADYPVRTRISVAEQLKTLTITVTRDTRINCDSRLKITLSDRTDPSFLCILIITSEDYDSLKKAQGLLVDFHDFPAQFVHLLQQCNCEKLYLSLNQQNATNILLEIIERNDFKRLVHLSLKTTPASDADIKKNMSDIILQLQKNLSAVTSTLNTKESMFKDKEKLLESRIEDLNAAFSRVNMERMQREGEIQDMLKKEREKSEREKDEFKRCTELHSRNQTDMLQENLNKKEKILQETSTRCQQLQDTLKSLESQLIDKTQRVLILEKQLFTAKSDAETWRNQNGVLDREFHDKDVNLQQTKARLIETEKTLQEKSNMLRDTLDSLSSLKREKITLEDRANHNETLAKKRELELQNINEDLIKANQIIKKQNNDILELREKLMCRTAIAIEQEKLIEKNSKEMTQYEENERKALLKMEKYETDIEQLQIELESYKQTIKEKEEIIKNNNAVIQWLHKKLDAVQSSEDLMTSTSRRQTPSVFQSTNTLHNNEDNNKLSDLYLAESSDSIISDKIDHNTNARGRELQHVEYGLDPVYLKPSTISSSHRSKSQDSQSKTTSSAPEFRNRRDSKKTNTRTSRSATGSRKSKNEDRYITSAMSGYFSKS